MLALFTAAFNFVSARWGFKWAYRLFLVLPLLIVAALLALAVWAGWTLGRAPLQVELANLSAARAEAQTKEAKVLAAKLKAAQERSDQLTATLAQQESQITTLSREKDDAIRRATTGRTCLDVPALRVLSTSPGLSVAHLPEATGSTAAADGPIATDTDVGRWAIQAGAQYETCRHRLNALIDWEEETPHED